MSLKFFYAMSPKSYQKWIIKHIDYCNFEISPLNLIGFIVLFSVGIGFAVGFIPYLAGWISVEWMFAFWAMGFLATELIMHAIIILIADGRGNFVETILPDALQIISANLRSGLTPDKAILTSARPEFGPLEVELRKIAKDTLSGKSFDEAMRGMTKKIKSRVLEKTVNLLLEGLAKGGSLTNLLDSVADDVRQIRLLRGEIKSFVMMYGIFIFFAAAIGAPMLYAISTYMVETISTIGGQVNTEDLLRSSTAAFINIGTQKLNISGEFLMQYSALAILITSVFGGLLIGLVQEGSEKAGFKTIPLLLGVSFGVFFLLSYMLRNIFGSSFFG
jgi:flagellar protein FlaJ